MDKPFMTICNSGINAKSQSQDVTISVDEKNEYILLANFINWDEIKNCIIQDLKKTSKKGFLNCGRKLQIRKHLGIYILQSMLNITDRQMVFELKNNAVYRIFCGSQIVTNWSEPHFTKIEEFRNRLSAETHHKISQIILRTIADAGFSNPKVTDFDSTVQQANISYPSDISLMVKLSEKAEKISNLLQKETGIDFKIQHKELKKKAKDYFFLSKNTEKEDKKKLLKNIHEMLVKQVQEVLFQGINLSL